MWPRTLTRSAFEAYLKQGEGISALTLETLAQEAHRQSVDFYGKVVQLYTPLYLSNYCENHCVYCAFHAKAPINRLKLGERAIEEELRAIYKTGIREVLLLTGEDSKETPIEYLIQAVQIAKRVGFRSVCLEVYPMDTDDYRRLITAGANNLTLYQETYNKAAYKALHLSGPKADYQYRLDAPSRAAKAGMPQIVIGALLGLTDPASDVMALYDHLYALSQTFPDVEWGLSLPRLQGATPWSNKRCNAVDDRYFTFIIILLRLAFPTVRIGISTRESHTFRRHIIPLGINKLSAGVLTTVGGYNSQAESNTGQFQIRDNESVEGIANMISEIGYQPIYSDWI